jgi:DNA-binding XRE family transcriptional regulator
MSPGEYKENRLKLGLSQAALAKRLGVSRETVSNRERDTGRSRINEEAAIAIRALLSQNGKDQS